MSNQQQQQNKGNLRVAYSLSWRITCTPCALPAKVPPNLAEPEIPLATRAYIVAKCRPKVKFSTRKGEESCRWVFVQSAKFTNYHSYGDKTTFEVMGNQHSPF